MTQRERQILQWIEENPMISQQELAKRAGITRSSVGVHISHLMQKGLISGKGYILPSAAYIVVAGGANMDVGGISFAPLVASDSNPGRVRLSLGGVGRNIAHNTALLGVDTRLIAALGDDLYARQIEDSCSRLGIDISKSLRVPRASTSTYLFVAGPDGDMAAAVSDMEICERLTPEVFASRLSFINNAQVLVLDANLPGESIRWLCEHVRVPIFADPVSTAKAEKLRDVLGAIHTLKPNRLEAEALSGVTITDEASLNHAADALLEKGVERIFLSLGSKGVLAADKTVRFLLPALPGEVRSTTGSGDAFTAALVWAYLEGLDLRKSARAGMSAAAIARESTETINPTMSRERLVSRMEAEDKRQ